MYANKVSGTNAYDASLAQLHPHMTNWMTSIEVPMWKYKYKCKKYKHKYTPIKAMPNWLISVEVPMWEMFLLRLGHLQ